MQDSPSKIELLSGVALFLKEELRPALDDKGLQYRALIAANLIKIVASEIADEEKADKEELGGLLELLAEESTSTQIHGRARCELINRLRQDLAKKIRTGDLENSDETFEFLKNNLKSKLAVVNPGFSTELEIE